MKKSVFFVSLAAVTCLWPAVASAMPLGPIYPPPGGVSFSSTGPSLISAPGKTRIYTGFNPSSWDELYWGLTGGSLDGIGFDASTNSGLISANTFGNEVDYYLSQMWTFFDPAINNTISTNVVLKTKYFDMFGNPILGALTNGSVGMPTFVLDMTAANLASWGGGFQVNQLYETMGGIDAATWFNSHNGGGRLASSTGGAFWYDPVQEVPPVPEPASLLLLGTGCVALARRVRRGRESAQL